MRKVQRKAPVPAESDVQRQVLRALELGGVMAWRQNNLPGFTVLGRRPGGVATVRFHQHALRGMADIGGIAPGGRIVQVEVKRPGGRLRPEQRAWLDMVAKAGGIALVAQDVQDVAVLLNVARISGWDRMTSPWQEGATA